MKTRELHFAVLFFCVYFLAFPIVFAPTADGQTRAVTSPAGAERMSHAYSAAVDAGDYIYISGQGPRRPDGSLPSNFDDQTRQALNNIKEAVESVGLTMQHIVYTQVYLEDIREDADVNRIFAEVFPKNPPARAVLGVVRVPEPPVEISAVAVRDLAGRRAISLAGYDRGDAASAGVLTRDRLFVSGMTGTHHADGKIPSDPGEQVDLALDRFQAVVKAAGLEMANVVFVNPYLTSAIPGRVMNEHYARRFEFGNTPARATIDVTSLPGGANIEYTGVAVVDLKERRAIRPKNMPPSPTASPCVFAGDTLYCSAKDGFIPGPHGGIYATTTQHQLRQSMRNLLDNLEEADMKFDDVVETNVYLDDLNDLAGFDKIYAEYFGPVLPARAVIQQIPSTERKADDRDHFPGLEQVSLIAVRRKR
jgi:enamine deaminase RidA (YjgF/YER057c/UK114 family)